MVFEQIEQLKRTLTDKYVVVNEQVPELRRFRGQTGVVKTVNMNGRALVQFDAYDNIGWFDIDVSYLKVIDQPLPKAEPKAKGKADSKPAAAAKPAAAKPNAPAAPAASGGKPNMADILAAARSNKGTPTAAEKPASEKPASEKPASEKPAAAKPAAAKEAPASPSAAAKADPKSMNMADILAAARANKGTPAAAPPTAPAVKAAPPAATAVEPAAQKASLPPASAPKPATKGALPSDTDGILAYCRRVDAKS